MTGRGGFGEFADGWRLVVGALFGTAMGLPGLPFYTVGIFAPFFASEFGWSFASIFFGLTLVTAAMLLAGPLAGMLIDRWGARLVSAISLPCFGLSYMTLAASDGSLPQYYASWAAIAFFGVGATPAAFTRAINRAFVERRGLALGIVLSGSGLFAFVAKPLAYLVIGALGWRAAIVVIGAMPLLIAAPMVFWGLAGERAAGPKTEGGQAAGPTGEGMTVRGAVHSRAFWILGLVFIPMSLAIAAPLPNIENILRWRGFSPAEIMQIASVNGIAIVAGRLSGGVLLDRFWAPAVGSAMLATGGVAWLILSAGTATFAPALAAVVLLGIVAGIELDLMAYLVSRYFGMRSYATLYATLYGVFAVGAGLGPSLLAHVFDLTGGYFGVLEACALMLFGGAALILVLGSYPTRFPGRAPEGRS